MPEQRYSANNHRTDFMTNHNKIHIWVSNKSIYTFNISGSLLVSHQCYIQLLQQNIYLVINYIFLLNLQTVTGLFYSLIVYFTVDWSYNNKNSYWRMIHWIWFDIHRHMSYKNMIFTGEYHIIFNVSLVNNCIVLYYIKLYCIKLYHTISNWHTYMSKTGVLQVYLACFFISSVSENMRLTSVKFSSLSRPDPNSSSASADSVQSR
jgi:hypothetical protein